MSVCGGLAGRAAAECGASRKKNAWGSDGCGESDEAAKAAKAARTEKAEKATITDKVAGGCTDHGAPSCGADRESSADRAVCAGRADRAKKPAGTGPPVTKRRGGRGGNGHKPAVMPWTPEHREALCGGEAPTPPRTAVFI